MTRIAAAVIGAAALIGMMTTIKAAQADPTSLTVNKCSSGKLKAAGKSTAGMGECYSKWAAKGLPVDTIMTCYATPYWKLVQYFQNPQMKYPPGCLTSGDEYATVENCLDFVIAVLVPAVGNTGTPSKCDAAKLKCAAKYINAAMTCYSKAANESGTLNGLCITKSKNKYSDGVKGCYDKAVAGTDCSNITSTADAVRTLADTFLVATVCKLNLGANPDCP